MTPGAGIFRTQLPKGFSAGGVNCGVRRYRPDLGIILSEVDCVAAAVYTQNHYRGAPITYCEKVLPADNIRAVITNSGEANAATGKDGETKNQQMADSVASALQCTANQVLTASTGVIGETLSIDKITQAVPKLLASATSIAENFAVAILTTDLVPKSVYKHLTLSQGEVIITGICKGSGMIHPNMATMLGYLLTDVALTMQEAQALVKAVCDKSFNRISVDGETSTNDCVFLLANGQSGIQLSTEQDRKIFLQALQEIAITLAKSIARDGEGASKLIEVNVMGVKSEALAVSIARGITTSPLIKTAVYGQSPNWGRIISSIGNQALTEKAFSHCEISIQGIKIYSHQDCVENHQASLLQEKLKNDTTYIEVNLHDGECSAMAWGCDLTEKYVSINAEYVT